MKPETVSQTKLDLLNKIITARLSKEELQSVTDKAEEILVQRVKPISSLK